MRRQLGLFERIRVPNWHAVWGASLTWNKHTVSLEGITVSSKNWWQSRSGFHGSRSLHYPHYVHFGLRSPSGARCTSSINVATTVRDLIRKSSSWWLSVASWDIQKSISRVTESYCPVSTDMSFSCEGNMAVFLAAQYMELGEWISINAFLIRKCESVDSTHCAAHFMSWAPSLRKRLSWVASPETCKDPWDKTLLVANSNFGLYVH